MLATLASTFVTWRNVSLLQNVVVVSPQTSASNTVAALSNTAYESTKTIKRIFASFSTTELRCARISYPVLCVIDLLTRMSVLPDTHGVGNPALPIASSHPCCMQCCLLVSKDMRGAGEDCIPKPHGPPQYASADQVPAQLGNGGYRLRENARCFTAWVRSPARDCSPAWYCSPTRTRSPAGPPSVSYTHLTLPTKA